MTIVVTVNVEGRYRGFLASAMLEIAPGVYTAPMMTSGIRDRIWDVLSEPVVLRAGARLDSDDLARPVCGGRAAYQDSWRSAEEHS